MAPWSRTDTPPLRVTVVSRCGAGRMEVVVAAHAAFLLSGDSAYFFIHRQSVIDEARSFKWHDMAAGDEVIVFDGFMTRAPAY
uniref:Uncharacterized protein n=1 Tax=Setaria italica TaxID=4555 RepID=K3ZNU1_SETIT